MATSFEHVTLGQRVLFGSGEAPDNVEAEVRRLGSTAVMVISGGHEQGQADRVSARIDVAVRYNDVVQHVPVEAAERARACARDNRIDLLVSIGGGSAVGLAKAVALTSGLPIVAVPTTYAGSEATNVWGLTEAGHKTTGVDDRVLPGTVVYDAELTQSLPVGLSVASGLNALAHCVDSLWGPRVDPINAAFASEGIRALAGGLPAVKADGRDLAGREQVLCAAYLSATAFASAGSGMHHKICHVLGGAFNLPHAETHAVVLPYVLAFNAPHAPSAAARIADALGADDAVSGLNQLRDRLEAPRALRDFGMAEGDIEQAARLALPSIPPSNPRPVSIADLTTLLRAAWSGSTAVATRC